MNYVNRAILRYLILLILAVLIVTMLFLIL